MESLELHLTCSDTAIQPIDDSSLRSRQGNAACCGVRVGVQYPENSLRFLRFRFRHQSLRPLCTAQCPIARILRHNPHDLAAEKKLAHLGRVQFNFTTNFSASSSVLLMQTTGTEKKVEPANGTLSRTWNDHSRDSGGYLEYFSLGTSTWSLSLAAFLPD